MFDKKIVLISGGTGSFGTQMLKSLIKTKVKLLEADCVVTEQAFNQQLADDLEAKSCADFGYEGVYLD